MRNHFFSCLFLLSVSCSLHAQVNIDKTGITIEQQAQKFEALLRLIDKHYVDSSDVNKLTETAMVKMLEKMDPHSIYIPPKKVEKMNEPLVGNFEGVGIQFNILKDTILVVAAISGGPSEKVGIMAGDKIIKIEGEKVAGVSIKNSGVVKKLRGDKGTKVEVSIKRRGSKELLDFTITRDKIPLYSVDASYMVNPETGYIRISRFAAKTSQEFKIKLSDLKAQGMKNLILDLQGNGGGYLNAAVRICDEFLDKDKMIVYTEGSRSPQQKYISTGIGSFEDGKLVVLINEGSASASEIVSGAVQDWDRGLVIGRRSFGKGLVQKPYQLPDKSIVRLTVAKYYTPSGRCIQRDYGGDKKDYYKEFSRRMSSGELSGITDMDIPDSLTFYTAHNRKVYGGGGVMPDIFVPIDTTQSSKYYSKLIRKGIVNSYTLNFVDQHRKELTDTYADINAFDQEFRIDNQFLKEFTEYADEEGLELDEEGLTTSEDALKTQLKALIARNLWGTSEYFQIFNQINDSYRKAIAVMETSDAFDEMGIVSGTY